MAEWETTPNGVQYREKYYTPEGVVIELERNSRITKEQLKAAKSYLRSERDVIKFC